MFDLMISCHKLLSIVQIQYLCSDFMVTLFEILLAKVQIVRSKQSSIFFPKRGRSQSIFFVITPSSSSFLVILLAHRMINV